MASLYKYPFHKHIGIEVVTMPKGARLLALKDQHGKIALWALVNKDAQKEQRYFHIYMTGQEVEDSNTMEFVGTVLLDGGDFVVHVFEDKGRAR